MNLLIVTGIFPPDRGGPASYVPRIAGALAERGHRVEVICLSDSVEPSDRCYPFAVRRIRRSLFWPLRIALTVLTIWRMALRNHLVYVNGLGAESALAALLSGRRTVHKIVGDYAWERAVGRGWFRGTLDEYQLAPKTAVLRMLDFIRSFPLWLAAQIIVPSAYLRRIVEGWGIAPENLRTIYNATPAPNRSREVAASPAWSGGTLITVCRLVRWKGVDALIRLLPELPEIRLVIAGDGHLRREFETLAREIGVAERAVFLGAVPHGDVHLHLKSADAFVLNSSYEGLPHVVLEAMSAGVPVIATDAGGTSEVVENEVTGLLIPIDDTAALKNAIERLMGEPEFGRQLAAGAANRLATRFDFDAMVAETEGTLQAAFEPAHPSRAIPAEDLR